MNPWVRQMAVSSFALLLILFAGVGLAHANDYAVFQLTTQCVWGDYSAPFFNQPYMCGPGDANSSLLGTFTINRTTGQVTSWDFYSQFSGNYYNNSRFGLPAPSPLITDIQDRSDVLTTSSEFLVHIGRSWQYYFDILPGSGINCCTYADYHDLYLIFPGSPETFAGGPLNADLYNFADQLTPEIYPNAGNGIWNFQEMGSFDAEPSEFEVLYSGQATLVSTYVPEPSSLLLIGSGILGILGITRRRLSS